MTKAGEGKIFYPAVFCEGMKSDGTRCKSPVREEGSSCRHHRNLETIQMGEDFTTIKITKRLVEALKKEGSKGETYEEILWRLLK